LKRVLALPYVHSLEVGVDALKLGKNGSSTVDPFVCSILMYFDIMEPGEI
jgi:hypothetical protein